MIIIYGNLYTKTKRNNFKTTSPAQLCVKFKPRKSTATVSCLVCWYLMSLLSKI